MTLHSSGIFTGKPYEFRIMIADVPDETFAALRLEGATLQRDAERTWIEFRRTGPTKSLALAAAVEDIQHRLQIIKTDSEFVFGDLPAKRLWYQCHTCGNRCLKPSAPDNSVCGGCESPDWQLMKHQRDYKAEGGPGDWVHPDGTEFVMSGKPDE